MILMNLKYRNTIFGNLYYLCSCQNCIDIGKLMLYEVNAHVSFVECVIGDLMNNNITVFSFTPI
jgi:hypothetical protein